MKKVLFILIAAVVMAACGNSAKNTETATDTLATKTDTTTVVNEVKTEVVTPDAPSVEGAFESVKGDKIAIKLANGEVRYYVTNLKPEQITVAKGDNVVAYYKSEMIYNQMAGEKVETFVVFDIRKK